MQDLVIRKGKAEYYFRFLSWDTEYFGKKAYILDPVRSNMKLSPGLPALFNRALKGAFISAKIDTLCGKETVRLFQECGFKYIDTEIVLKHTGPSARTPSGSDIRILELRDNAGLPYKGLGSSFRFSRFHMDPNIAKNKADRLWISYIKNYRATASNHIFAAKTASGIGGVILANICDGGKKAVMSFVAVLDEYRGKGIGSRLSAYVAEKYADKDLFTETQVSNKEAVGFYINNGFRKVESVRTILHRW